MPSSECIRGRAQAKINIGLNVLPRRADGFHGIESIFVTVPLADELEVARVPGAPSVRIECDGMELPEENTFTAAYRAFCAVSGQSAAFSVRVCKHIPAGGGLGGGSSDAAFFIRAMDALCGTELPPALLDSIAAQVGSDVFFFLRADFPAGREQRCALVGGRGEKIECVAGRRLRTVLLLPGVHSSTQEAYRLVDEAFAAGHRVDCPPAEKLCAEFQKPAAEWRFANAFTAPLVQKYPAIGAALHSLRSAGADFADMSGSGSTVFGIFEDAAAYRRACAALSGTWGAGCVPC